MAWLFVNRWTSPATPTSLWITLTVSLPLLMMLLLLLPTFTTAQILTSNPDMLSDNNNNNNNYRTKRSLSSGDCSLCFSTQDPVSCQRCLSQNLRRVMDNEEEEEERQQGDVLAVSKKWTYEPMRRYQRGSGCSCCYFSRMTNVNCCSACSMTTKRAAPAMKRSGGMTSGDDALMTSERVRGQGAILGRLNCQCCDVTGDDTCCLGCLLVL